MRKKKKPIKFDQYQSFRIIMITNPTIKTNTFITSNRYERFVSGVT